MTLLQTCNADVFAAILEVKDKYPLVGENLLTTLQKHEFWWQMTGFEILQFVGQVPNAIWNGKFITFHLLFQSQQTTVMP